MRYSYIGRYSYIPFISIAIVPKPFKDMVQPQILCHNGGNVPV